MSKVRDVFNYIIALCLFVAALIVIGVSSVTTIYYDMHSDEDWPHYGSENILFLILGLLLVFAGLFLLYRLEVFEKYSGYLMAGGIIFSAIYCMMLILVIHPQAVNDSKALDDIINAFSRGDYSSLTEPGGYLFTWPFQLGYVGFGQIMHAIFGESNYFAWDMVQLVSILVTIWLIYKITWELFEERAVCGFVAIISCGALFFYNYVTYIYGDIISMAPQTLALYMMVLFVKRNKAKYAIASAVSIAVAILLKTNCEIALIALIMVLLGSSNGKKLISRIVLTVLFLILVFGAKRTVDAYYCKASGLEVIPAGSPSWSHIAMGLQESPLEDGWYNGYNYKVFEENNYDSVATAAVARENIMATLTDFANRPLHGARFLVRKFATQWADSVCISTHNLDLVSRHVDIQSPLRDYLVFGSDKGCPVLIWIMNIFMPVCYIGVAVYLFGILRGRKTSHQEMLLLILIFGGIMFHEFWEGSSRYTMRYYIYWLPYAGYGLNRLFYCDAIGRYFKK